jgi:hypothetical protein
MDWNVKADLQLHAFLTSTSDVNRWSASRSNLFMPQAVPDEVVKRKECEPLPGVENR